MTFRQQEYIANMLRHSSYKKWENYVLTKIYWTLVSKGIVLKFNTQQTVFRKNAENHVAYMDGYFPALNIQLEVDEPFHQYTSAADKRRQNDITHVLGALRLDTKSLTIKRIDITKDIDSQCDEIVKFIETAYVKAGKPKWEDISVYDIAKKQGYIKYTDNMLFGIKSELVNIMGKRTAAGKEYTKHGTQSIPLITINDEDDIWFPCIADNMAAGWENKYDESTDTFYTHCTNYKRHEGWLKNTSHNKNRYIFFKVVDAFNNRGYKYYGKYKCISFDAENQHEAWQRYSVEDFKLGIF